MSATYGFLVNQRIAFRSSSLEEAEQAARIYAEAHKEIVLVLKFSEVTRIKPR